METHVSWTCLGIGVDAVRLVSSFNIVEELTFKERGDKGVKKDDSGKVDISLSYYMQSTLLANHDAVTPASLPSSSDPPAACREVGAYTSDERSFGVTIRSLSTVTASKLLVGAFLLEGSRPVCTYHGGRIQSDFSWAMGGHVDLERLEELDVDLKDRYRDLRRLERLDVGWEGRYLNLHRIMGRCLTYKSPDRGDSCDDQVRHQIVDFKQVLDAYASALRQAERRDNPTPDIRSLLRHRDATQHTSENNFFYRLLRRKP
ncbi:hypothetical protein CSOJ01_12811 [Colletotrichum sojae]|uniref:Uncharacterized protein n=1 Tax=Colletotrichum sojae TaxID=2175907 RepID=A0A8H6IUH2_9PEZI|nr:hypothetical protein CSOJ01_12811 [Colletotrichum sojae]